MKLFNKFPIFKRGNVITKEDLDLLRDNSIEILKLSYMNLGNGIIKGFDVILEENGEKIVINKGILKCGENIYWSNKKICFDRPFEENEYVIKAKFSTNIQNKRYYVNEIDVVMEIGFNVNDDEIEICRFISRNGAELRNDYKNFSDLKRDYNLIEIINSCYCAKNEKGKMHNDIMKIFLEEAKNKEYLIDIDKIFLMLLCNDNVERETIVIYINERLGKNEKNYTNDEIYYNLLEILEKMGQEKKKNEQKKIVPKKITVD